MVPSSVKPQIFLTNISFLAVMIPLVAQLMCRPIRFVFVYIVGLLLFTGSTFIGDSKPIFLPEDVVNIGKQTWSRSNLNVERFNNGDTILHAQTAEAWIEAGSNKVPAWCYYANDSSNSIRYGKLYNWYALNDPRGLAPSGWHVATYQDWNNLVKFTGGLSKAGNKLKSATGWSQNLSTNASKFTGLPGGMRDATGVFDGLGQQGNWWCLPEFEPGAATCWSLIDESNEVSVLPFSKKYGFSVRCVKN